MARLRPGVPSTGGYLLYSAKESDSGWRAISGTPWRGSPIHIAIASPLPSGKGMSLMSAFMRRKGYSFRVSSLSLIMLSFRDRAGVSHISTASGKIFIVDGLLNGIPPGLGQVVRWRARDSLRAT